MTAEAVVQHEGISPLATWSQEFAALPAAVELHEIPLLTQLSVRVASPAAMDRVAAVLGARLPEQSCTALRAGDRALLWLGPDEWLVVAPPGEQELVQELEQALAGDGAVVDVSAQRTTLHLAGRPSRDLLAHGCSIDLDPRVNRDGSCVQTYLAKAGVVLVTWDAAAGDYWVIVRASFADYLAGWLVDACVPYQQAASWR